MRNRESEIMGGGNGIARVPRRIDGNSSSFQSQISENMAAEPRGKVVLMIIGWSEFLFLSFVCMMAILEGYIPYLPTLIPTNKQ